MASVADGRTALDRVLTDEASGAKDDLLRAIAKAKAEIAEAEQDIAAGNLIRSTASGEALLVPENLNSLGTLWMAAERRRIRLLALYDQTNEEA